MRDGKKDEGGGGKGIDGGTGMEYVMPEITEGKKQEDGWGLDEGGERGGGMSYRQPLRWISMRVVVV